MVPKELADLFEAIAGAILEDSKDIMAVWRSFFPFLSDVLGITKQFSNMQDVIKLSVFLIFIRTL